MRVYDYVRNDSVLCKRHILVRPQYRKDALLTMSRTELVTNYWVSFITDRVTEVDFVATYFFVTHQSHILNSRGFVVFEAGVLWFAHCLVIDTLFSTAVL